MRVNLPFLMRSRRADGTWRWRFRRHGRIIALPGHPGEPAFIAAYDAAMRGEAPPIPPPEAERGSLEWLIERFVAAMERRADVQPATIRQRKSLLGSLIEEHGDRDALALTPRAVRRLMAGRENHPASANNLLKSLRAMYRWAVETGLMEIDPTQGVPWMQDRTEGFRAWTLDEVRRYLGHHRSGTPRLAMMLLLFTACRRSDLAQLGRQHIRTIDGIPALSWRQAKTKGLVEVPILAPLAAALEQVPPGQMTFLISAWGRPYTVAGLGMRMRGWCDAAGCEGLSAHGVRKAAGALLAEMGCSEHEIMAVLGHENPRTSAVYTRSASRWTLARSAMAKLDRVKV